MTPSPQDGQNVTGNEDIVNAIRQVYAEEAAKATGNNPQALSEPKPIPVTLNGQTFNFNSPEELSKSFQGVVDAYNTQLQQAQTPVKPALVTGNDDPEFSVDTFVSKMTTDPREAFNYVDQYRYGVKDPAKSFKDAMQAKQEVDEMKKVLSIYQFRDSHPDVSGNQQAANVIANIVKTHNLAQDASGLEAAYSIGVVKGLIPPPQQFQQNQPQQRLAPQPQNPYQFQGPYGTQDFSGGFQNHQAPPNFAPPRVNRQTQDSMPDFTQLAEGMTADQLQALMSKFQGQ